MGKHQISLKRRGLNQISKKISFTIRLITITPLLVQGITVKVKQNSVIQLK